MKPTDARGLLLISPKFRYGEKIVVRQAQIVAT